MPPQAPSKQFEFTGTPGSFFSMFAIAVLSLLIPIAGLALSFNRQSSWFVSNIKINGRRLAYKANFSEVLVLLLVGILLTVLTIGIYLFWFVPKMYSFVAGHTSYEDEAPVATALPTTPAQPIANPNVAPKPPTGSTPPAPSPTPPTNLIQ